MASKSTIKKSSAGSKKSSAKKTSAKSRQARDEKDKNLVGASRHAIEGQPPETGEEGGIVKQGTGDYAPETETERSPDVKTVKVMTRDARVVEDEVGIDGENPVSPQNPPTKASLGGGHEAADSETHAEARNEGVSGDRVDKEEVGANS